MAAPTIQPASGYLGYYKGQAFDFQVGIVDGGATITSVIATGLPAGASIASPSGLVTFNSTVKVGQYNVMIQATNSSGSSAWSSFFFVIDPAPSGSTVAGSADTGVDLDIDVVTKGVTVVGAPAPDPTKDEPLMMWAVGDVAILNCRFKKNGVTLDPNCTEIAVGLEEFSPDPAIVLVEGSNFEKDGTGADAVFRVPVPLTDEAVKNALSNYENDKGTVFTALANIRWKQEINIAGVTEQVTTTRTFPVLIIRPATDQ